MDVTADELADVLDALLFEEAVGVEFADVSADELADVLDALLFEETVSVEFADVPADELVDVLAVEFAKDAELAAELLCEFPATED
ncbi:hypothetical protein ACFP1C_11380 [Levilactobacillus fujinensis]|uniref:Carrier domain-containing protein n=1 Tax=Levilactobacillus fujinensis TaxID=2486024 RepID=A0ABW1TJU9_9LACO